MAKEDPPFRNQFTTSAKAQKELRVRLSEELQSRLQAKTILDPDDVHGAYDFQRVLFTTLGGSIRPIRLDDLKHFSALTGQLGRKYKGGITAKQIIDMSNQLVSHVTKTSDKDRANREIHTAMPVTYRNGRVQFQTNAGTNSQVQRHHVVVEFLDYSAVVASPIDTMKASDLLRKGKIKVDCDCQRFRYFFRYIATAGRFNAGRPEVGYPKLTNHALKGVACKHIVRVCGLVAQSPTFKSFAAKMVESGRKTLDGTRKVIAVKEMEKFAKNAKGESWRQRKILTTDEKRAKRKASPSYLRAMEKTRKKSIERAATKAKSATNRDAEIKRQLAQAESNMRKAGLPDSAIKAALKAAERDLRKAAK